MIIYIRFTTKDTSSKYITCTLVVSKLSVLKPYKYMSLSNILKPYIFYLSSDCETFFNIWKHKSIACVFKLLPLYSLKSRIQLRYQKVQVGKDQEKAQSEKDSHSKNRGGKKPN